MTNSSGATSAFFALAGTYQTSDFFLAPDSVNMAAAIPGGGTDILYVDRWDRRFRRETATGTRPPTGPTGTPSGSDNAVIDRTGTYTVTVAQADVAHELYLDSAGATLNVEKGGTLNLPVSLFVEAGTFELSGGTLTIGANLVIDAGTFTYNSGSLSFGPTSGASITIGSGGHLRPRRRGLRFDGHDRRERRHLRGGGERHPRRLHDPCEWPGHVGHRRYHDTDARE